jgi:hypothetical protein
MKEIAARMVLDSISSAGIRLSTVMLTMPRMILAELNTHRALTRNSGSLRAIPGSRLISAVREDPFIPQHWTTARKGMQGGPAITDPDLIEECRQAWLTARDDAVRHALHLLDLGLHKQVANRVLEPYLWHTALISFTESGNFLALRDHPDAEPHFADLAACIVGALERSKPVKRGVGEWHLPFTENVNPEIPLEVRIKISTARCARVSYVTPDGSIATVPEDLALYRRLHTPGHWSPFEHPARAMLDPRWSGNFYGWFQHRKEFPGENRSHRAGQTHTRP